jgi:hypothetical protein
MDSDELVMQPRQRIELISCPFECVRVAVVCGFDRDSVAISLKVGISLAVCIHQLPNLAIKIDNEV